MSSQNQHHDENSAGVITSDAMTTRVTSLSQQPSQSSSPSSNSSFRRVVVRLHVGPRGQIPDTSQQQLQDIVHAAVSDLTNDSRNRNYQIRSIQRGRNNQYNNQTITTIEPEERADLLRERINNVQEQQREHQQTALLQRTMLQQLQQNTIQQNTHQQQQQVYQSPNYNPNSTQPFVPPRPTSPPRSSASRPISSPPRTSRISTQVHEFLNSNFNNRIPMNPSPSIHPQFRAKTVCTLYCNSCKNTMCNRGMKAILLGNTKVELYSTDTPPSGTQLVYMDYTTRNCLCRIRDAACLGCGNVVGYHVTQPCEKCLESCNNGHFWMFHADGVYSVDRTDISDKLLRWAALPLSDEDKDTVEFKTNNNMLCR